jgi:hypothetical protein
MANLHEIIDSLNDETVAAEVKQQLKAEADALSKANKELYSRAKKAEGFEYDKTQKQWVKKAEPAAKKEENKKDSFDYGQKAFIASVLGVKGEEELALLKDYLDNGKKLEDLADNKHFQNDLKDLREVKATKDATPSGTKRSGNTAKDSVEYWLAKGELPPADQPDLRRKVVNAKIERQKSSSPF